MFRTSSAFAAAAVLALFLATPVVADDLEQIEKASRIADEASNTWGTLGAFEKEEALLLEAEKAVAAVDETGKAPVTAKIKECRERIAATKASWDAGQAKSILERQIGTAESYGDRLERDNMENHLKNVETALADGWLKGHLDAAVVADLQKKIAWARKKFDSQATRSEARALTGQIGRIFDGADRALEGLKGNTNPDATSGYGPDSYQPDFDAKLGEVQELLAKDENRKALGDEQVAAYKKRIDTLKVDFAKTRDDVLVVIVQRRVKWIQDVIDGKNKNAYTNNVEEAFKGAQEDLAKCPQADPRTKKLADTLAQQRKAFDAGQAQGARDDTVKPMVEYWTYVHENYAKDTEGWEAETTPPVLKDFLHNSPPSLGCDKTEKYAGDVLQRFFDDERVKKAVAQFGSDPDVKKVHDQARAELEKAGNKICAFASKLLDEGEKLPEGRERDELKEHFYNLKVTINRATKGCAAAPAVIARIDGLEKKIGAEKAAGEAAKQALDKKLCDSVNAAWPELSKPWAGKAKKIDAPEAVKDIGSWKGTIVHFSGGARGVNLNRSGWSFKDDYYFIVESDGTPVCGNLDQGLADAIAAVEQQTRIDLDNVEEVYGVVDGVCKARTRFKNPLNDNDYLYGPPQDAVRFRILAVKGVTVAAAVGQGTNLSKLPEFKEVSVSEAGTTTSGGGKSTSSGGSSSEGGVVHFVHRLVAWAMCALLALAGALALAHGASKFVPQIQEQKAKLGDYLGYAGAGFAVVGVLWFGAAIVLPLVFADVHFFSLPAVAMILAGVASALDLVRPKGKLDGKLSPETASLIQPVGIVFGLACFPAAGLHFLFWNHMFL